MRTWGWGARLALLCGASLCLGCGPIVMFPGGRLSGEVAAVPTDWSFSNSIDTVQIETRPGDPYSVNVWGVAAAGAFYVSAGDRETRWARHIAADPNVRLKVCEDVYEMRAVEVRDAATRAILIEALAQKYDFTPSPAQQAQAAVFRLEPR